MASEITDNNEATRMDHEGAVRIQASSRYLAGELSASEAEAFEDHYFDCAECGAEVALGDVFAQNLRAVFHDRPLPVAGVRTSRGAGRLELLQRTWAVPLAAAACLLLGVLIYQNLVTMRGLRKEMARLSNPPSPVSVPLKIAREEASFVIPKDAPFWIAYFRLPDAGKFRNYACDIENSNGATVRTVAVSPPQPGQPFFLVLPGAPFATGTYKFKVRGENSGAVLATYTIDLIHN